jgi:hypothetical protein
LTGSRLASTDEGEGVAALDVAQVSIEFVPIGGGKNR